MKPPTGCSQCGQPFLGPTLAESRSGVCERCRVPAKPPPRKPAAVWRAPVQPCQRCGHEVLVRCHFADRTPRTETTTTAAPLAIGFERRVEDRLFGDPQQTDEPDTARPIGVLEGYFCRACGMVVWFVRDPQSVPIGPAYGTELVDLRGGAAPYR